MFKHREKSEELYSSHHTPTTKTLSYHACFVPCQALRPSSHPATHLCFFEEAFQSKVRMSTYFTPKHSRRHIITSYNIL